MRALPSHWLVVHITFMTGFKNRLTALIRWFLCFMGTSRLERAIVVDPTNCSLATRDFMVIVMRLFDNTAGREPIALQQGGVKCRKDETMPNADTSLSLPDSAMQCSSGLWRYMPMIGLLFERCP
jgi:hypothetical protein